jgi:lon-related putative ATP-dependent protease
MDRSGANTDKYAAFIAAKCKTEKLLPFDRTGVARVVEHGSRIAEHQNKLTTKFNDISDLLREAHFWAKKSGAKTIDSGSVEKALAEKRYRHNRVDDLMQEQMNEGTMIVETSGLKTGQINGLAVIGMGDYSFGKPSRITASTYAGRAGVVNIERETKMSGKIHDKAILILSNFLGSRFARKVPITLTASITFEQLYGMIEGDSATCAEFYALVSSISGVPIRQDLAITGSMDQNGNVQPIGGVNEKIEGFFDLCLARGLKDASNGVVIPALNLKNLMLKPEVVLAAAAGKFHIRAISHIDEGMEILMGMPAGVLNEDGAYPENTINYLVEKRLTEITEAMKKKGASNNGDNGGKDANTENGCNKDADKDNNNTNNNDNNNDKNNG